MPESVSAAPYDPEWPRQFAELAARIRTALGPLALRIDHVGSTAIPGLAARPIIDVQVSVQSFDNINAIEWGMNSIGLHYRPENPDKTQRCFRETPGERRARVHVRRAGSFQEEFTLLFRDYLRRHPADARAYEENKQALAPGRFDVRQSYMDGSGQAVWSVIARARKWSEETGWQPGESDA